MYCVDKHIHVIQTVSPGVFLKQFTIFRFCFHIISHATSQILSYEQAQI